MKVSYEIWKLPTSHKNKFIRYDWATERIKLTDYVCVYKKENVDCNITIDGFLENLFEKFNINEPSDYFAESMSVSDVICLIFRNNTRFWYYVDGVGFKQLSEKELGLYNIVEEDYD